MSRMIIAAFVLMLVAVESANAQASYRRPGAAGAGRIGALCENDFLSKTDQQICTERMKAAKTDAEKDEVRAIVKQKIKEQEEWYENQRRRQNATSGRNDPR